MCITSKLGKFAPNRIHSAPTATAEDAFQREPAEYAEFFICASHVRLGSWPCKNALRREVGEKSGPVRSQATIAAISGLIPTMFMTRVRL
jgi:hypothetical protein